VKTKAHIAARCNRFGAGRGARRAACARRALALASCVSFVVILAVLLALVASAGAEGCPNEARREEQGAAGRALPDCRAYELVTPASSTPSPEYPHYWENEPLHWDSTVEWDGRTFNTGTPVNFNTWASGDGNALMFYTREAVGPSAALCGCISRRTPSGWVGENPLPTLSPMAVFCLGSAGSAASSQNFEQVVIWVGEDREHCGHDEPPLEPGEPNELENATNLFLRDGPGSYHLVDVTPPGVTPTPPRFDAISADGSHVVFESQAPLTPDTPDDQCAGNGGPADERHCTDLYIWDAAQPHSLHLLTVLPNGAAVKGPGGEGAFLAGTMNNRNNLYEDAETEIEPSYPSPTQSAEVSHAISANGERILFYAGGTTLEGRGASRYVGGGLYLREHPDAEQSALNGTGECTEPEKACTIQIDIKQGGSGSSGEGQFRWASADTSKIFFTDVEKLTPDASAAPGEPDLYEYDVERPEGQRLADITVNAGEPADVLGVSGASEDGSYVYFVASGKLTGAQSNSHGESALAGAGSPAVGNLYLRHAGVTTFIATLNGASPDLCDWTMICDTARVSQNGAFIAFNSSNSLTGYDNVPVQRFACGRVSANPPEERWPCDEIFRYAAGSGPQGELTCASCHPDGSPPASQFAYAQIENPTPEQGPLVWDVRLSHNLSNAGEVFFSTIEKLVPSDENDTWDVYEYGGGEGPSAQLHLVSSGKSEEPSYFYDASPSGRDVFFITTQALLRSDTRSGFNVYDAREGGGFAEPLIPPCEAEGCRLASSSPPAGASPASASLEGKGNIHPVVKGDPQPAMCEKGRVKKKSKCVTQRKKKPKTHEKPKKPKTHETPKTSKGSHRSIGGAGR
jgi:hypothetical protein